MADKSTWMRVRGPLITFLVNTVIDEARAALERRRQRRDVAPPPPAPAVDEPSADETPRHPSS